MSRTLNSVTAKTASARSRFIFFGVTALVAFIVVLTFLRFVALDNRVAILLASGQTYALRVVTSSADQQKGLGGLASMPSRDGMLFLFNSEATHCFWMKDMHFPLDIIWLSSKKQVVHVEEDLAPQSYPSQFCPSSPSQYVVELNAGETAHAGIRLGETLTF